MITKMKTTKQLLGIASLALLTACGSSGQPPEIKEAAADSTQMTTDNILTTSELADGFQLLFDGKSLQGWHLYLKDSASGWKIEDGVLITPGGTGDLVTNAEYENFELLFDWKIQKGGNGGVFYYIIEDPKHKTTYETAPEYQLIDDVGYPAPLKEVQKSGANYDMIAPNPLAAKTPGEWNAGRIVVNNGQIEHWLNGTKVVAYTYGDDAWKQNVAASKFAKWGYATPHTKGKIGLQDHGDPVSFKNIKLKVLPTNVAK